MLLKQELEKDGIGDGVAVSRHLDEKPPMAILSGNALADTAVMMQHFYFSGEQSVSAIHKTLKRLASEKSCVIIGRCASAYLAGFPILSVFIYAKYDDCIQRISARNGISEEEARKRFKQINRLRKQYFDFYSETKWGHPESYDLMLSSSTFGVDGCVKLILQSYLLKGVQSYE